ncbi:O-antigen ligase family protein [Loktanella sp. R86503]|uniref:O-antigen ligase family protein n=1 Tax=Loktanella sp. R86503 TaxID=3093847 RepID=UPI0036DE40AA
MTIAHHMPRQPANLSGGLSGGQSAGRAKAAAFVASTGRLPPLVWLYLLAVILPAGFNVGPLAMTGLRVMLLVMTVPLLVRLVMGHYGKVMIIDMLFIVHIIWATLAMAVNNPDRVIENIGAAAIEFLGGYVVGRAYIRNMEDFRALCRALMILVLFSAPFALVETLTGRPILLEALRKLPGINTVAFNTQDKRFNLERVQFGFAHPIHYGLFCSVAFSMVYVGLKDWIGNAWRIIASIVIAGCGFLALSSGALLAIFLQIGLIAWATIFTPGKARWWLLVGLFALAYVVIDILSNRTPLQIFMSYATFSAHTAYWRSIIFEWGVANVIGSTEKGIIGSPLFGIGLKEWIRPYYMYSGSMDNFWLVMAVRYGIPGFATVTLGYILGVARIMRRDFDGNSALTQFRLAWVFTFLGLSFTLCTVHVWTSIYSFVFFFFGAGMWFITVDAKAPKDTDEPAASDPAASGRIRYTRFAQKPGPTVPQSRRSVRRTPI